MKIFGFSVLGFIFVLIGAFLLLNPLSRITGFAVFEKGEGFINPFLGILFVVGGILMMAAQRRDERHKESGLENEIKVYNGRRNKEGGPEDNYMMTDPHLSFGRSGVVSLGEFRRTIQEYRENESGELIEIVREEYGKQLREIAESWDEDRAGIAQRFLEVLYENESREDNFRLSQDDRREIREAFKNWRGRPTDKQTETLTKYGLAYEPQTKKQKHPRIAVPDTNYSITATSKPGEPRIGKNMATDIIRLIEKVRKKVQKPK